MSSAALRFASLSFDSFVFSFLAPSSLLYLSSNSFLFVLHCLTILAFSLLSACNLLISLSCLSNFDFASALSVSTLVTDCGIGFPAHFAFANSLVLAALSATSFAREAASNFAFVAACAANAFFCASAATF